MIRWLAALALAAARRPGRGAGRLRRAARRPARSRRRSAARRTARAAVQAGLRVVFGADDGCLSDGIIGPVTLSFLGAALRPACRWPTAPIPSAAPLDLARRVRGAVARGRRLAARIADPALLAARDRRASTARSSASPARRRLGATALGGAAIPPTARRSTTAALVRRPGRPRRVQAGLAALIAADPTWRRSARRRKRRRPGSRWSASARSTRRWRARRRWSAAVQRLGRIEAAVPGALATLGSPSSPRWLAASRRSGSSRLLGTVPAVVRLLPDYFAEAGRDGRRGRRRPRPARSAAATADLFLARPRGHRGLTARAGIRRRSRRWRSERFDDRDALGGGDQCGVLGRQPARLRRAAGRGGGGAARRRRARSTALDAEGLKRLALRPRARGRPACPGAAAGPRERQPRRSSPPGSRRRSARRSGRPSGAAAGLAADAAAAAAEDVSPAPDTPAPGHPRRGAGERPSEEFAITDTLAAAARGRGRRPGVLRCDQRLALPAAVEPRRWCARTCWRRWQPVVAGLRGP